MLSALVLNALVVLGQQTGYPSITTKKELYAEKDVRGKLAPEIQVDKWLSGAKPNTQGKVVIVDFWATWCPPCRATIPELNGYAKKFADDVVVIGISDETAETLQKFMATTKMDYNVAIDKDHKTSQHIGVKGIPHVIVISPDGIVRWQGFPLDDKEPLSESVVAQIVAASKHGKA